MRSKSDVISVDEALEHHQVIPFLGGQNRAEAYLFRYKEVYGNNIGVWHSEDLHNDLAVGRLLFVGDNYDLSFGGDDNDLDSNGRFVGYLKAPKVLRRFFKAISISIAKMYGS